jgi:pimeloyl-ACP methyl ester carboxylesterase
MGLACLGLGVFGVAWADGAARLVSGDSEFEFSNWAGSTILVRTFIPEKLASNTPIVIVMHGASRDGIRYYGDWKSLGKEHGFVVVVPEFPVTAFAKSARYNLGHVFDVDTGKLRDEEAWTFSAIEPLFDEVVERISGQQISYTLYGHSAGSQFVHRFLYYKPQARASRYIAANAGWYTLPLYKFDYPYGLEGSGIEPARLAAIFEKDLIILLGSEDIDPQARKLRQTEEAKIQGPHRLARGVTMYRTGKATAREMNVPFNWRFELVKGADHDNAKMAPAAAELVDLEK